MTHKLEPIIGKIKCPIRLLLPDGSQLDYASGTEAAAAVFEKHYIIQSLTTADSKVVLELQEVRMPEVNWIGEEEVSFF